MPPDEPAGGDWTANQILMEYMLEFQSEEHPEDPGEDARGKDDFDG